MHLSNPVLGLPPVAATTTTRVAPAPLLALLAEGGPAAAGDAVTGAIIGGQVWVITQRGTLKRYRAGGAAIGEVELPVAGEVTIAGARRGTPAALIESDAWCAVVREGEHGALAIEELGPRGADRRILVGARVAERRGAAIRIGHVQLAIPADLQAAHVGASALVLDDSTLMIELAGAAGATVALYHLRQGALTARIRIGESRVVAVAERANLVVLARGPHVALLDVRAGRCVAERILTAPVAACAIDDVGATVAIRDTAGNTIRLGRALTDIDGVANVDAGTLAPVEAAVEAAVDAPVAAPVAVAPVAAPIDAAPVVAPVDAAPVDAAPDDGPHLYLHALGAPRAEPLPREELAAYLAAAHAWVQAVCAVAVASRRADAAALAAAREREHAAAELYAGLQRRGAPDVEIANELGLSATAATALMLIAAPQIWCDLARDYAAASGDAARPLVDELLVASLLEADLVEQAALGRELDADGALVRCGAVVVAPGTGPCTALSAHPAIVRRLAGAGLQTSSGWVPAFADFVGPRDAALALATALEEPRSAPARVALRGKPASGRRTLAAMLAALAGRDVEVTPAGTADLARRLRDIALRGNVPVVDMHDVSADDEAKRAAVRAAFEGHAGPLFVRAERDTDLPFTPTDTLELPMLTETERAACWRAHLDDPSQADALAARYAIGPGAIVRAAAAADPIAVLRASRGHRVARLAERVERLATWDALVVPAEIEDALRELVSRVQFRRTVLETWGMGDVATTARGTTALLQGGPGTGKTMAAGVIARALGYELWRVDLSKVVSKWIGETERNLAQLFDAAEEGEIVLLFDEADALFTKRTEVRSANDKHANAATNYLLQRLDSFTGIAILTTNFGTAIDNAFRRRLSVQVEFPFPDEAERLRLWRAHLPAALPTAGDLRLKDLAETYELSGGYIRNAALRAAYLAAARSTAPAITADDLRRAIALEKERVGKLGNGRIE